MHVGFWGVILKNRVWKNCIFAMSGIACLLLVWCVAASMVGNEWILPNLFSCLREFFLLWKNPVFWNVVLSTLLRVIIAFSISLILAVIFSVVSYLYPAFSTFFAPILAFFRTIPVLGVLLILLVWTNSSVAPVIVAVLSLFPILYTATYAALSNVDQDLIEMSRVYQVPLKRQLARLYFPSILPTLLKESGAAISFGVKLVVSAEVLSRAKTSLGDMMQDAQIFGQMPMLFALLLFACALGFLLETVFVALSRIAQRRGK